MTDSIHKQVIDAIAAALTAIGGGVAVETNTPLPETVPDAGLIIVRDGKPDPTEEMLGGFDTVYVVTVIPVEVYVSDGDNAARDAKYDALLQAAGAALLARDVNGQRSLGGLVYGLIVERPEPVSQDILGAAPVKAAMINVRVEYQAPSPLN